MKNIKGNLLDLFDEGEFDVIAHGANCYNMMGAGIAGQIKKRYPYAVEADNATDIGDYLKLGSLTIGSCHRGRKSEGYIINLYSQYAPGRQLDYEALTLSLRKMRHYIREMRNKRLQRPLICTDEHLSNTLKFPKIGLPLIGCGIAGGDWNRVQMIIEKELSGEDVTIVHFEK